jgi:hypothetical protein
MTQAASVLERAVNNCVLPVPLRAVIIGGPRTGKTTLGDRMGSECAVRVRHIDDLIKLGWGEDSKVAATWIDDPGEWIIEGVAAVRALRKWMANNPGKRLDGLLVVYLRQAVVPLTPAQFSTVKGVHTIWLGIEPELRSRGAEIRELME